MALVAERPNAAGEPEILAVGRMSKLHAEMKPNWLPSPSMRPNIKAGNRALSAADPTRREEKLSKLVSNMLPENREMRALCTKLGFKMFASWKTT